MHLAESIRLSRAPDDKIGGAVGNSPSCEAASRGLLRGEAQRSARACSGFRPAPLHALLPGSRTTPRASSSPSSNSLPSKRRGPWSAAAPARLQAPPSARLSSRLTTTALWSAAPWTCARRQQPEAPTQRACQRCARQPPPAHLPPGCQRPQSRPDPRVQWGPASRMPAPPEPPGS
jgi:hypothetical protein